MKIRERGTMLGRLEVVEGGSEGEGEGVSNRVFWDPNKENLAAFVSCKVSQSLRN